MNIGESFKTLRDFVMSLANSLVGMWNWLTTPQRFGFPVGIFDWYIEIPGIPYITPIYVLVGGLFFTLLTFAFIKMIPGA